MAKLVLKLYVKIRRLLIAHPFCAVFLSHGGVHVMAAIFVVIFAVFCFHKTNAYQPVYKQVDINIQNSFNTLNQLDMDLGTSPNILEEYGELCGLSIIAGTSSIDTSLLKKEVYHGTTRYVQESGCNFYYYYPKQSLITNDKSYDYSELTMTVSSPNSHFRPWSDNIAQGDTYDNTILPCHLDSLSSSHIKLAFYPHLHDNSLNISELNLCGDCLTGDYNNPYYNFAINLKGNLNSITRGTLRINLQSDYHKCDGIATNPMNILQCVPQNYSYNPIEGITIRITDVISNGGVYLLAEDLSKKEKNSKTVFLYTVLIGTSLAFLLDILIDLIVKWKLLSAKYSSKKDAKHE